MSQEANAHEEPSQAHGLPIVVINKKRYFADERLWECRAVDNPHERIPMDEAIYLLLLLTESRDNERRATGN
jgi:hypothetical protein